MATTRAANTTTSDIAIFGRILADGRDTLKPQLARYILTLGFSEQDQAQMQDLAARNQQGRLSPAERDLLLHYVKAGHLLALLHSRARVALKKRKVS